MSVWFILLASAAAIAAFSTALAVINLALYARPRLDRARETASRLGDAPPVSICVPARNEAANIEACVFGVQAQRGASIEVLVYDDQSTDGTGEIVARLAATDSRVQIVPTQPLPPEWNGKQHACQRMAEAATGEWLLFTDADVRFEADAVAAALSEATRLRVDLISTFPRQLTGSLLERLVVPLIHFILFSYLPFPLMRWSKSPIASAGCGQFLLVRRSAWQRAGGHASLRASMHDGIQLPRRVRASGGRTDLFDGTALVSCRMYRDFKSCWNGFAKNAYEGLGSFPMLCIFTLLNLVAHVLPWVWLIVALTTGRHPLLESLLAAAAISLALFERVMLAIRFRQSWLSVVLHPLGIVLMTAIQWHSWVLTMRGAREWRGRRAGALQSA